MVEGMGELSVCKFGRVISILTCWWGCSVGLSIKAVTARALTSLPSCHALHCVCCFSFYYQKFFFFLLVELFHCFLFVFGIWYFVASSHCEYLNWLDALLLDVLLCEFNNYVVELKLDGLINLVPIAVVLFLRLDLWLLILVILVMVVPLLRGKEWD